MFNDVKFIEEVKKLIGSLDVNTVLEVGCYSGELIKDLENIEATGIDIRSKYKDAIGCNVLDYNPDKKFDIVFSSGVVEHYDKEMRTKLLKKMASLSNKYVLTIVPHSECEVYKQHMKEINFVEDCFNEKEVAEMHEGILTDIKTGTMGLNWAQKFGKTKVPYLVYCLGRVNNGKKEKNIDNNDSKTKGKDVSTVSKKSPELKDT